MFDEPYQITFFAINLASITFYYSVTLVLPQILSQIKKFRRIKDETKAISDDFYKECSIKYLLQEYLDAKQLLLEISEELRHPFSKEGRAFGAYMIKSPFTTEQQRRVQMSRYYAAQK
jgi:hypothetical protein